MNPERTDLVALALGQLGDEERARLEETIERDPAAAAELREIRAHLALHDSAPRIEPRPATWRAIVDRLDENEPRPFVNRFWMPLAAAALVAAAFIWPRTERPSPQTIERIHGNVRQTATGGYRCSRVSRIRFDGVTVTMDADTEIALSGTRRLALRAGRVHLEVPPEGRGLTVVAGDLEVVTTGTAFTVSRLPGRTYVAVLEGAVRCNGTPLAAGERFPAGEVHPGELTAWFRIPTLRAEIVDAGTLRIVVRNEMPDAIQLAPPTGGEPLFFASYAGHDHPLNASGPLREGPVQLRPGEERAFRFALDEPVPAGAAVKVSYKGGAVRVRAEDRRE